MRRLVYAPNVQAFVKTDEGVIDLSSYLVSGSVTRKLNQVSQAQLTFRNPATATGQLLFTQRTTPANNQPHPALHPMDPIIIVMQRLPSHAVQVFTGYLDKTPYIQLYPGLCSLTASCTLKRLLYTQWDAALPFVKNFLEQYGWVLTSESGIANPTAEEQRIKVQAGKLKGQFNDGSLGALLSAILQEAGGWDPSNIAIEALPPQIKDIVTNLYEQTAKEATQGSNLFKSLISQIIGSQAQGTGSSTNASATGLNNGSFRGSFTIKGAAPSAAQQALVKQVMDVATALNPPKTALEALLEACIAENDFTNNPGGGGGSNGLLQLIPSTAAQAGISPFDVPGQVRSFMLNGYDPHGGTGAIGFANSNPGWPAYQVAQAVQRSGAGQGSNGASNYGPWLSEADAIIAAYIPNSNASSPTTTTKSGGALAPRHNVFSPVVQTHIAKAGTSPGGKSGNPSSSNSTVPTFPLATGTFVSQGSWTQDQGVDIATIGGGCGTKAPLLAMGAGTVVKHGIGGFGPSAPVLKLDTPIQGQGFIYYGHAGPDLLAPVGSHVNAGQPVASVGCGIVGLSTGPHLEVGFSDANGTPVPGTSGLMLQTLKSAQVGQAVPGGATSTSATTSGGSGPSPRDAIADAFSTFIELPSIFSSAEALAFTGKRSFIADQPLFPFIEQLSQASLRSFQSMPNGNFFAFFPDYFGFFGRKYYWEIRDIEIINAQIDLADDPLVTNVAVAGDVTQYHGTVDVFDLVLTSGIFDIFDAFATHYVGDGNVQPEIISTKKVKTNTKSSDTKTEALAFLKRYGARPYVEEAPMIRSPFFELFLAFQKFMLLWSKQFQTTFELTFMPEIFPGGLVGLPDHNLQVYVEEVQHDFDYEGGFRTTVFISSPTRIDNSGNPNLHKGLSSSNGS